MKIGDKVKYDDSICEITGIGPFEYKLSLQNIWKKERSYVVWASSVIFLPSMNCPEYLKL